MTTAASSRPPAVGIERLPVSAAARRLSIEPRESMNCKSCRKRKIKCNRLRPTCEACQVFQCPCIYDAVPKKRGPKTDILEALLKRVDGLERRLKDEKQLNASKDSPSDPSSSTAGDLPDHVDFAESQRPQLQIPEGNGEANETAVYTPTPSAHSPTVTQDVLLDTYFLRVHGKPYFILDEGMIRARVQAGTVPAGLLFALYAVGARYAVHPSGYHAAVRLSEEYVGRARADVDADEPSIETLQTLLLLVVAQVALGNGKKAYMLLGTAIGMAMALELHREADAKLKLPSAERAMRRRLFWSCYLMDRFGSCGSKRPSLISDSAVLLRLPSWSPNPSSLPVEGDFFQNGSNLQYHAGSGKKSQGSSGLLIDIVRILGNTSRYLSAGGVKGDSHFPWHSLSNLSKIRQDLDIWASGTTDIFASLPPLLNHPDSTLLILSKLVYHLIHVLLYRPFLPIDLAELAGTGQHQSWQIEATNLCFLHANAIAELVELGRHSAAVTTEWPAFVGYCVCSAGTVHVHGVHYRSSHAHEVFSSSTDLLSREMQQLSKLRYSWALVQHQRDTLQALYGAHADLVKSLASNPMRYSPVFHLEDFFDRYSALGAGFDGAHISFTELTTGRAEEVYRGHNLYPHAPAAGVGVPQYTGAIPTPGLSTATTTGKRKRHSELPSRGIGEHSNNPAGPLGAFGLPTGGGGGLSDSSFLPPLAENLTFQPPPPLRANAQHHRSQSQSQAQAHNPLAQPQPQAQQQQPEQQQPTTGLTPFYNSLESPDLADPMFGMQTTPGTTISQHAAGFSYEASLHAGLHAHNAAGSAMTPGAASSGGGSVAREGWGEGRPDEETDPFLTLLEQLAENEYSGGGPSELDFFLGGEGA